MFSKALRAIGIIYIVLQAGCTSYVVPLRVWRLTGMADKLQHTSRYREALPLCQQALALLEKARHPNHPTISRLLIRLGKLYQKLGDYRRAEPLLVRALKIAEITLKTTYIEASVTQKTKQYDYAEILAALGLMYFDMNDYERSEHFLREASRVMREAVGVNHHYYAATLSYLGSLYRMKNEENLADSAFLEELRIIEKSVGIQHREYATTLNNLGVMYRDQGNYPRAEEFLLKALSVSGKIADRYQNNAIILTNIGAVYQAMGRLERAEWLYRQALTSTVEMHGPDHPEVSELLLHLASTKILCAEIPQALALVGRAVALSEKLLITQGIVLPGSRLDLYLNSMRYQNDFIYSLLAQHGGRLEVRQMALQVSLLHMGRSASEESGRSHLLHNRLSEEERRLFEQLRDRRERAANLALHMVGELEGQEFAKAQQKITQLEKDIEQLAQTLTQRTVGLRSQSLPDPPTMMNRVAAALDSDSILLQIVEYQPIDFHRQRPVQRNMLRYGILSLTHDGQIESADLGDAGEIDQIIRSALQAISRPDSKPLPVLQAAYRKIFLPILPLIGKRRHLVVVPDGQFNVLPLALLHDGSDYLHDSYLIRYLTSGLDLLQNGATFQPATTAVVFADPAFEQRPGDSTLLTGRQRHVRLLTLPALKPLPGARKEAEAIRALWPNAQVLMGTAATDSALLHVQAPPILHVATHSLFGIKQEVPVLATSRAFETRGRLDVAQRIPTNPLLRSGLALAGISNRRTARLVEELELPDGLVTAQELAGINLWGTQLVVLSACDSGNGDIERGHGVYGLRRAVLTAGAQTLVTSLWQVDDEATQALMEQYYQRLHRGVGRAEALRQAALEVRKQHDHPYFWGAFISIGQVGPLQGIR